MTVRARRDISPNQNLMGGAKLCSPFYADDDVVMMDGEECNPKNGVKSTRPDAYRSQYRMK